MLGALEMADVIHLFCEAKNFPYQSHLCNFPRFTEKFRPLSSYLSPEVVAYA
jgi:hypothetical protein